MTWFTKIRRLTDADAASSICDRADCTAHTHGATYKAETVSSDTAEVRRVRLCTKAAAMLAHSLELRFPPGPEPKDKP